MKGIVRKIIGIAGIFIVVGVIVMVALAPRKEGFFPDLLSFKKKTATEHPVREVLPAVEPQPVSDTIPQPAADSLSFE